MTPLARILMSLMDRADEHSSLPELLCQDARDQLPMSTVGMAVMREPHVTELFAGADQRAVDLESLQLTLGEGPCVEAFTTGRLVQVPDFGTAGTARWPFYGPAALEAGVSAAFSFPLQIGAIRLGVLDLYRDTPGRVSDETLALALTYADAAVMVLLHLEGLTTPGATPTSRELDPTLTDAFHGHPEVHQATGMVSIQAGVDLNEALLLLRAYAFTHDRRLVEVAHDVVSREVDFR